MRDGGRGPRRKARPFVGRKAGYLLPSEGSAPGRRRRLAAFAIDDLTAEEEEELLKYLAFIRSRTSAS